MFILSRIFFHIPKKEDTMATVFDSHRGFCDPIYRNEYSGKNGAAVTAGKILTATATTAALIAATVFAGFQAFSILGTAVTVGSMIAGAALGALSVGFAIAALSSIYFAYIANMYKATGDNRSDYKEYFKGVTITGFTMAGAELVELLRFSLRVLIMEGISSLCKRR